MWRGWRWEASGRLNWAPTTARAMGRERFNRAIQKVRTISDLRWFRLGGAGVNDAMCSWRARAVAALIDVYDVIAVFHLNPLYQTKGAHKRIAKRGRRMSVHRHLPDLASKGAEGRFMTQLGHSGAMGTFPADHKPCTNWFGSPRCGNILIRTIPST